MEHSESVPKELFKIDCSWRLKAAQDILSFSLNVPLQLYCPDYARRLPGLVEEEASLIDPAFDSGIGKGGVIGDCISAMTDCPDTGMEMVARRHDLWFRVMNKPEARPWLSGASFSSPLVHILREHRLWRWWEILWLYRHLAYSGDQAEHTAERKGPVILRIGGFAEERLAIAALPLQALRATVIVGPVWLRTTNRTPPEIGARLLKKMESAWQSAPEAARHTRALLYDPFRIDRIAQMRAPITEEDLVSRAERAVACFDLLARSRLAGDLPISGSTMAALGTIAVFLEDEGATGRDNTRYLFAISTNHLNPAHNVIHKGGEVWIEAPASPADGLTLVQPTPQLSKPVGTRMISFKDGSGPDSQEELACADLRVSRLLDETTTKRTGFKLESFMLMRNWLNDKFGMFARIGPVLEEPAAIAGNRSANNQSATEEIASNRNAIRLARWVTELFNADGGCIYQYDHRHRELEAVGHHFVNPSDMTQARMHFNRMLEIADDPVRRSRSICYRAVDLERQQTVRNFRHGNLDPSEAEPGGDFLELLFDEGGELQTPASVIATPIRVLGRIWGVLELVGHRPYQFRRRSGNTVAEIASIMSAFFYQQSLLAEVHRFNYIATDARYSPKYKYREICRVLCRIFMTESATLWIQDPDDKMRYFCAASVNRVAGDDDLPVEELHQNSPEYRLDDETRVSRSAELIRDNEPFVFGLIRQDEGKFNGAWLERLGCLPVDRNYKTACLIKIPHGKSAASGPPNGEAAAIADIAIGTVTLLGYSPQLIDERWRNLTPFVAHALATALEAIYRHLDWDRKARRMIAHDMRFQVRDIEDKVDLIVKTLSDLRQLTGPYAKLALWREDLQRSTNDLKDYIDIVANKDASEPGTDPVVQLNKKRRKQNETLDPEAEVKALVSDILRHHQDKMIDIRWKSRAPGVHVRMSGGALRDMIRNLIFNAVKYSSPGATIFLGLMHDGKRLRFLIANQGLAIHDEDYKRIWDKGYRGLEAKQRGEAIPGEGLGLYHVKQICDIFGLEAYCERINRSVSSENGASMHTWIEFVIAFPKERVWIEPPKT
jgi:signal transduction histidine kinase